jgi:hypothetical protein
VPAYVDRLAPDTVQGDLVPAVPMGWEIHVVGDNDALVFVDTLNPWQGVYSGCLLSLDNQHGSRALFRQPVNGQRYAGQRVRFRAHLKTHLVEDRCGLWVRVDSDERESIALDDMAPRPVRGTTEWKPYQAVLEIPPDATRIYIGVVLVGIGQVWIDDCSFEIVGPDVPTTAEMSRSRPIKHPVESNLPPEPENLDFEGELQEYLYE